MLKYWKVTPAPYGMVIVCRGHDKEGAVDEAIRAFHELAGRHPGKFVIAADLREMTGYETESRVAWRHALYEHRERIHGIVAVGARSAFLKMAAAAVGAFVGVPIRFVETWDEAAAFTRAS